MGATYAVVWEEGESRTYAGKLSFGRRRLELAGMAEGARESLLRVDYGEIDAVRMARSENERIGGRRAIVLERRRGKPLRIGVLDGVGILGEIAETITSLAVR